MDELKLLGVALGLACLAGVNLYLTVFVTGLAIHQHWIVLSPAYQSLAIVGDPLILWISGTLYVLEFFADKIPWVDSAWDTVHTIIRPIGGALLAIRVLGQTSPAFDVIVALSAGGASLVTHSAKASTRLVTNASPEPFSNIGLSLLEDVGVIAGLVLIHFNPVLALGVFVLLLAIILYFAPRIFRAVRVKLWLIWKKLNRPAEGESSSTLPTSLPSRYSSTFARENLLGETIAWAVPCISKRLRGVPANSSGLLIATNEDPAKLDVRRTQRLARPGSDDQFAGLCRSTRTEVPFGKSRPFSRERPGTEFRLPLRAGPRRARRDDRGFSKCAATNGAGAGDDPCSLTNLPERQTYGPPLLHFIKWSGLSRELSGLEVRGFEPLAFSLRTRRSTN